MTTDQSSRQQQAKILRAVRKIHRWTGISLFVLFMVVSLTGLLLGWKKNSGGYILPDTAKGISTNAEDWLALAELQGLAESAIVEFNADLSPEVDRMDVRPNKGIVKFTFVGHYREVQLDLATGEVLSTGLRRSDFLEHVHDGSIIDQCLGIDFFKLVYTSLMGLALLVFTLTGFWLWYGPKRMRRN